MSQEDAKMTTQELAIQRTEMASERTRLANERTLIAWLRTGIAITAFGAVVPRLLASVQSDWMVRLIAILFVVSGSIVMFYGVHNYRQMTIRLEAKQVGIQWWLVAVLTAAIELGAIMILLLFLFS